MAERVHHGPTHADEERQRTMGNEGGHTSHEKGAAHEYDTAAEVGEAERRGNHARNMAHVTRSTTEAGVAPASDERREQDDEVSPANEFDNGTAGAMSGEANDATAERRSKKTRGGTHDQHVTAGKKGGSRIRELIELGYKYEQEHGIGPGRNERSRNAAKRRASKAPRNPGAEGVGTESASDHSERSDEQNS